MNAVSLSEEYSWPLRDIVSGNWSRYYQINNHAPFYFKLNDSHVLMQSIQKQLKENNQINQVYSYQLHFMEDLKKRKFWMKLSEMEIIQMSVYDVYMSLLKHIKDQSFEDELFNSYEISFIGPLGPFKHSSLIECLNTDLIDKFVFADLLKNRLPLRRMRIRTNGLVDTRYGIDEQYSQKLNICQITDSGILFSTKNDIFINNLESVDFLKVMINTNHLKDFIDSNFTKTFAENEDLFYTDNVLKYFYIDASKIQKSLSFKSVKSNEYFLFCRYVDMKESECPSVFMEFVSKLKDYFHSIKKSA